MSNHHHMVLHIDHDRSLAWNTTEVIRHWHHLFTGHPSTERFLAGESFLAVERKVVDSLAEQ